MTLINAMATRDAAYLLTDTALYRASDGYIVGFGEKALVMPRLGLAVAVMGLASALREIEAVLEEFRALDDVEERFPAAVKARWDDGWFSEMNVGQEHEHFRLTLAGWSPSRNRAVVLQLASFEEGGAEAFTWRRPPLSLSPPIVDPDLAPAGLTITPTGTIVHPSAMEGPAILLSAAAVQRRDSGANPITGASGILYVGGDAVLTKVAPKGISQIVVHRWPDELHTCIDASKDEAPEPAATGNVVPLSRQQRRAQEREARKSGSR